MNILANETIGVKQVIGWKTEHALRSKRKERLRSIGKKMGCLMVY